MTWSRVLDSVRSVQCLVLIMWGLAVESLRGSSFGFRISGSAFRVSGLGFGLGVPGFKTRASGFGFRNQVKTCDEFLYPPFFFTAC